MKPQCTHTGNSLLTYTEMSNDAKDCVRFCPLEVTDSSVTNLRNQLGGNNESGGSSDHIQLMVIEAESK